jgi:hypothetical protein
MKKANHRAGDDMRPEYRRSDLGTLVRGKYAQRMRESSNVVVIEPDLTKAFPNAKAVNAALRRLLRTRKTSAPRRTKRQ